MRIPDRIHVLGASGSGTTTLASHIASEHGHRHADSDDFFWLPTQPPFQQKRPIEERLPLLRTTLSTTSSWVLSGSLCGWGDELMPDFQLVVFISLDPEVRLARLRAREAERYGEAAISLGGEMHEQHLAFLQWAAGYDDVAFEGRSRALHETWMDRLTCPVVRLDGDRPVVSLLKGVEDAARTAV